MLPTQLQCDAPSVPGEPVRQIAAGQGGAVQKRRGTSFTGFHPFRQSAQGRSTPSSVRGRLSSDVQGWLSRDSKVHGTFFPQRLAIFPCVSDQSWKPAYSPRVLTLASGTHLTIAPVAGAAHPGGCRITQTQPQPRVSVHICPPHPAPGFVFAG